jgi:hypothetical protein
VPVVPTSSNKNLNVTWDTSPHGSGNYDPSPGPGSYNQPDHAPANGYSNKRDFYLNAMSCFYTASQDLKDEASQFKGQAGEAFYNLINNLFTVAESVSGQLGNSLSTRSYCARFAQSGVMNAGSFGNLLSDATWVAVENQAKQLWLTSIQETLDTSARSLINALTVSYLTAAGIVKP